MQPQIPQRFAYPYFSPSANLFNSMNRERVLEVAISAARAAGAHILKNSGRIHVKDTKADYKDLVTQTDSECQDIILLAVRAAFGDSHSFLGEEDVPPGKESASLAILEKISQPCPLWIVDPIDGTTNFVAGLPLSCVSIGVAEAGTVNVAVIYDPYRDEIFTAIRGQGAKLNGEALAVIKLTDIRQALFGWGLHHQRAVSKTSKSINFNVYGHSLAHLCTLFSSFSQPPPPPFLLKCFALRMFSLTIAEACAPWEVLR